MRFRVAAGAALISAAAVWATPAGAGEPLARITAFGMFETVHQAIHRGKILAEQTFNVVVPVN